MEIVAICYEMKWTYFEYMDQPEWFLDLLKHKMIVDSDKASRDIKRAKNKHGGRI